MRCLTTLNQLLYLCARRDTRAFQTLYQLTSPRLYSLALYLVNNKQLAEEVLQQTYLSIWNGATLNGYIKRSPWCWMLMMTCKTAHGILLHRSTVIPTEQRERRKPLVFTTALNDQLSHDLPLQLINKRIQNLFIL